MPPTRSSSRTTNLTVSVSRNASIRRSAAAVKPSIRLTVKAPPSKLRQALGTDDLDASPYGDGDTPEPPVRGARSTRNPRTVVDPDSDEDMEDEMDVDGDMEDETGADEDADELDADEDGEDEDEEEDEDEDEDEEDEDELQGNSTLLDRHPPPPVIKATIKQSTPAGKSKVFVSVSAPSAGGKPFKSVEAKEQDLDNVSDLGSDDDDGEELSDLDEDEDEEDADGDDPDEDADADADMSGSEGGTPMDPNKLTRRQRAAAIEEPVDEDGSLLALSNEAQKKKHLTAEEHAMRRAEMARRRKNLSEKRNEEEKMDTINKLLSKPAPKRRTRAEMMAAAAAGTPGADGEGYDANPLYVRWVNSAAGSRVGVPVEWLEDDAALGKGWDSAAAAAARAALVEEVQ